MVFRLLKKPLWAKVVCLASQFPEAADLGRQNHACALRQPPQSRSTRPPACRGRCIPAGRGVAPL